MNPVKLTHLIYTSAAAPGMSPLGLSSILQIARKKNAQRSVTGMLLYASGSFFQVLEGDDSTLMELFAIIALDPRHTSVTKIIHEPIAQRVFSDWTMGFAQAAPSELASIEGFSDFFQQGQSLANLQPGRAKKMLSAFAQGRWRARLKGESRVSGASPPSAAPGGVEGPDFSFAFQPIIDTRTRTAYSHEALVRGMNNEPADQVISRYAPDRMAAFDATCRARAVEVAAQIGIQTLLNINCLPSSALNAIDGLDSTIAAAHRHSFPLERIIVEATEGEAIGDPATFAKIVNEYRRAGMRFAIDDFGAGYSGLNLLSEFQPDIVKLDMGLVRDIQSHGPRQAIVRAIAQVCVDLGIDFVVEGVETTDEFSWFTDLGVHLYQGYLFAKPMFQAMPSFNIPKLS